MRICYVFCFCRGEMPVKSMGGIYEMFILAKNVFWCALGMFLGLMIYCATANNIEMIPFKISLCCAVVVNFFAAIIKAIQTKNVKAATFCMRIIITFICPG